MLRMIRTRSARNLGVLWVAFLLAGGCENSAPSGAEATDIDPSALLATVEIGDGQYVDFIETEPGVVVLRERIQNANVDDLGSIADVFSQLSDADTSEERYLVLAGSSVDDTSLVRIRASDARNRELIARVENGDLELPPIEEPTIPTTPKEFYSCGGETCEFHEGDGSEAGFSTSTFQSTFCPSGDFDDTWCWGPSAAAGDWRSGWSANTDFFRTIAWNSASSHGWAWANLLIWNGSSWAQMNGGAENRLWADWWVNYYSFHPWTQAQVLMLSGSQAVRNATVWNFD